VVVVCVTVAAISAALRFLPQFQAIDAANAEFLYRLTPFRLEPLCYGALLALLPARLQRSPRLHGWMIGACVSGALIFTLAVIAGGSITKYSNPMIATYGFTGADWVCAGLVGLVIVSRGRPGFAALLRNSTLRRFGELSYAMYVFHIHIAILLTLATARLFAAGVLPSFINIGVGIACTYGLAVCSWHWIEAPLLSLKARWAPPARQPLASLEPGVLPVEQPGRAR
jgi:peptidoglycan/LPS O-acetylase OafA/YrhL